jgi:hypothetical protein
VNILENSNPLVISLDMKAEQLFQVILTLNIAMQLEEMQVF